jgi:transcriptional regulator with XRE-family HTH domain
MTTVHGPTVGRRRLRTALRSAREAQGRTQEQVAEAMDWSLSKLIRIEAGTVGISTNDLRALLGLYRITDPAEVEPLVELARAARRKPWWAGYRDALPSAPFMAMIGLEADTSMLRHFQPITVPGLLQTEAYARTILRDATRGELAPSEIEARVTVRLARQRDVIDGPDPPTLVAILDESVLRRVSGDKHVMRDQLRHLLASAERPTVTLRVMPFSAGPYPLYGQFVILSFPDEADTDVVYLEAALEDTLIEDPADVAPYDAAFRRLLDKALDPKKSLSFISRVARDYD